LSDAHKVGRGSAKGDILRKVARPLRLGGITRALADERRVRRGAGGSRGVAVTHHIHLIVAVGNDSVALAVDGYRRTCGDGDPPPSIATILPAAERLTAACANPESAVLATRLVVAGALVAGALKPLTSVPVALEIVVMASPCTLRY